MVYVVVFALPHWFFRWAWLKSKVTEILFQTWKDSDKNSSKVLRTAFEDDAMSHNYVL